MEIILDAFSKVCRRSLINSLGPACQRVANPWFSSDRETAAALIPSPVAPAIPCRKRSHFPLTQAPETMDGYPGIIWSLPEGSAQLCRKVTGGTPNFPGEQYANRVRKVDQAGAINVLLSGGFDNVTDLTADPAGNLFIADRYGCRVMKLNASGNLTKVAGNGCGYGGDGGPATSAKVSNIFGIALNASGELFIGDHGNGCVRKMDKYGNISTVAGAGSWGSDPDGGLATRTRLPGAFGVAVDPAGDIYIVEPDAHRVRMVSPQPGFTRGMEPGDLSFVEENGLGHIFSSAGLHLKTIDLATGVVLASFGYNTANRLISITDRFGGVTGVERDGNGVAHGHCVAGWTDDRFVDR